MITRLCPSCQLYQRPVGWYFIDGKYCCRDCVNQEKAQMKIDIKALIDAVTGRGVVQNGVEE